MSTMWEEAQRNHLRISKWTNYFPIYDRYFAPWRGKKVKMLEIGVQQGGSLELWKRYLGAEATIVGIDHEPRFAFEDEGIHVRVGEAQDVDFLRTVLREFYPFDIVLDDGSKVQEHIRAAFDYLYPHLSQNGFYLCEDLYTCFVDHMPHSGHIGGNLTNPPFLDFAYKCAKQLSRTTAAKWTGWTDSFPSTFHTRFTKAIHFHDSIVVFERGETPPNSVWEFGELRADP